ncbi:MAG: glyoxalase [Lachnospiraceae bacterium]|jgi:antitoxin component HigA of HigAB toxin-antitoxin module|nr:glyoxalase [Lachnospiraceae bacterium]
MISEKFDKKVLEVFLRDQKKLFDENVAETEEEAEEFLTELLAVVADSLDDVKEYMDQSGMDISGLKDEDVISSSEVFDIGDGRFLIVYG